MRVMAVILLAAGCAGDDGAGGDSSALAACVDETNRYRAMNGKAPVTRSPQLEEYADTGAMVDFHGTPHQHFSSTQGGGIAFAENECPHWNAGMTGGDLRMLVLSCIAAFYSEGPGTGPGHGHYNNMMGNYGTLGCGIYQSGQDVTIVQDFGR